MEEKEKLIIALDIIEEFKDKNLTLENVEGEIKERIIKIEVDEEKKIQQRRTINLWEHPTFEDFKYIVQEILEYEILERTPDGEHGGDAEGIFYWDFKEWNCVYAPDWNRYDKQYYYIDDCGDNLTITEIVY